MSKKEVLKMKKTYIAALSVFCLCVWFSGVYTGYAVYGDKTPLEIKTRTAEIEKEPIAEVIPASTAKEKITPLTDIVYEYHYDNGSKEIKKGEPPNFLVGLTLEQTTEIMPDWNVESFSERKVVFSKNVGEKSEKHYIVSNYNGYVAAFAESKSEDNLLQVTSTPVASLHPEEQETINRGIILSDKYELSRCMENYSS